MGQEKPGRRERERQKRIELILDKAEGLFLEKGFAATTMDDIAKAAEFGRATLYHYFPSKEAIYVAALERAMDSFVDKVAVRQDYFSALKTEKRYACNRNRSTDQIRAKLANKGKRKRKVPEPKVGSSHFET